MILLRCCLLLILLLLPVQIFAAEADVGKHATCAYCGMDRDKYAHSRMLIVYDDSTEAATCSLRCAAVDLANNIDRGPAKIMVGDFNRKTLIDAESAVWVIGGNKPGVMTARPKWAFADKKDAEAFIAANGGTLAGFEQVMKGSFEDLYEDTRIIRERRKLKKLKLQEEQKSQQK